VHNFASAVTKRFDYAYNAVSDITAVQRDSTMGDGYSYDLTQQITEFKRDGTVNLSAGTVTSPAADRLMEFDGCGNRTKLDGAVTTYNPMNTFRAGLVNLKFTCE
jgi:pyridoxal biosynthesis lyase PdxS